jgi:hypothetical protein
MRGPPSQFTLAELIGLVALCGMAFALLRTWAAPLGVGVLIVIPGFALGCARGGKGIIGGMLSGCLIPLGMATLWFVAECVHGIRTIGEALDFLPALFGLCITCLMWSALLSTSLHLVDRRWLGASHRDRLAARFIGEGIRFLPDDNEVDWLARRFMGEGIRFLPDEDRSEPLAGSDREQATSNPDSEGGMDG